MKSVDIRYRVFWFGMSVALILCSAAQSALAQTTKTERMIDYLSDIKPVLAEHCVACHGPKKQNAGLRLDTAVTAIAGGDSGPAIVVGDARNSLLLRAIIGDDDVEQMPPKGPRLPEEKIELLRIWIDRGARAPADEVAEIVKSDHW